MKRCGFIIRVSTDRQAANQEGSLKNQLQRLRAHLAYKNTVDVEEWVEAKVYVLKGVSGKDSLRSKDFAEAFEDIRTATVNTIACTALDRISRSVKDFLNFFEVLNEQNIEFVCLKQNYDTTTPQGKLLAFMMMALAQFEREQTSERNKEASLARAERGLWNGGQIIGYDLDPDRKGYIIPNTKERVVVNFAADTYLECGSIRDTLTAVNQRGFRTKEYTSRRGKFHPAREFPYASVQWMLMSPVYIGKKEINKGNRFKDQSTLAESERYRLVDAVWEPIMDEEKFYRVEELMRKNGKTRHNVAKRIKHNYLLNHGLLWCGKCGSQMEGVCGTGRKGKKYYYYVCKNRECRFKVSADEIEGLTLGRIAGLAQDEKTLAAIVATTNEKMRTDLPSLREQRVHLQKELEEVKSQASALLNGWTALASGDGTAFLKEKLDDLGKRRNQMDESLEALDLSIAEVERDSVDCDLVVKALADFSEVFAELPPYRQKELMRLVLHKAILGPDYMKMALYGRPPEIGPLTEAQPRSQTLEWLPEQMSESAVLWDGVVVVANHAASNETWIGALRSALMLENL